MNEAPAAPGQKVSFAVLAAMVVGSMVGAGPASLFFSGQPEFLSQMGA